MAAAADCNVQFFEPQWCDDAVLMALPCPCLCVSIAMDPSVIGAVYC